MEYKLNLTSTENKDLTGYCNLNDLLISEIIKKSYLNGFRIEKYGLLSDLGKIGTTHEKPVEIEVIREKRVEVPVEVVKEVVKIEYVEVIKEVEKIVEVIREVPATPIEIEVIKYVDREVIKEVIVEVPVSNIEYIYDKKEDEVVTNLDNICYKPEINIDDIIFQHNEEINDIRSKFSTKEEEMVKIFQQEKEKVDELLLKIQQLENQPSKIVETIKEVIVEKEVIKETTDDKLKPKLNALQNTVQKLKLDNIEKDKLIKEYEKTIQDIQKFNEGTKAMYMKGSNLDDGLYKNK
jgi:hypothetical protein